MLTESECFGYLSRASLGRIAASIDALPVILPIDFALDNQSIVFAALAGSKLDAATAGAVVAFQADGHDPRGEHYWTVLVQGIASSAPEGAAPIGERTPRSRPWPELAPRLRQVRIQATIINGHKFRFAGESPRVAFPDGLSSGDPAL